MAAAIDAYVEGRTEAEVLKQLCVRGLIPSIAVRSEAGGDGQAVSGVRRRLGDLDLNPEQSMRILLMIDKDGAPLFERCDFVRRRLDGRTYGSLVPHREHENVFTWQAERPDLRIALHIAAQPFGPESSKPAIDDYLLQIALTPGCADAYLDRYKKPEWQLSGAGLIDKVRREIPELLRRNGMSPCLPLAKDYIRFYAAVLHSATAPEHFARNLLCIADEALIRLHLAPLLGAITYLGAP